MRVEGAPSGFVGSVWDECAGCGFAVAGDHRTEFEVVGSPPFDVGVVTECAEHEDACALVGVSLFAREDWDFGVEAWGDGVLAEEGLEAFIVGMCGDGDACGDHFGARG